MTQKQEKDLKKEIELTRKKAQEYLDGWKRAKADYINFKKDTEKKQTELIQFANAALIMEVIPIYDHLKTALNHLPEDKKNSEWVKGIKNIKKQFQELLTRFEIKEIETTGEKFNPEFHEAVSKEKAKGKKAGVILSEVKPGYKLNDKVLIPAKVKVAE